MTVLLAASASSGVSRLRGASELSRGDEDLAGRLRALGAIISRWSSTL
jgi:UDP-N-acetylglucosamine enolpyruvyl transferase